MKIVGIDPGLSGAVAVLNKEETPDVLGVWDTPTLALEKSKRAYDIPGMLKLLCELPSVVPVHVFIERQQAFPGQGVSSMFKIGYGYGLWLGILSALKFPYTVVSPVVWTKAMLAGIPGEGKDRSIEAAHRLFPNISVGKSYRGRADALLIAEYGRRSVK